ncbi:MAG: glutathione S-transferase family protein [Rhodospirillaceae bacterium]|nr:glutathione S-transferase family protein [Rhodospirillaceae bacterium]MBT3930003.1 glutathione S-transferase family protein [Rhodospirillaceae bacterium]MBT4773754.1 glutathione S-transferase family protein [Rhodospirillaceae bacterium]MBT5357590.1 glutathione S-transferase family protein [Rhodospirillaceae bacterium]MBT5770579.1 glutathione S-transferase family protein [Rhodospirillaceae bacterium]
MTIVLYDLVGRDDRRFSSNCWKTSLALAHKGCRFETVPTKFTEIPSIGDGSYSTVPVVEFDGIWVDDSWAIAEHLEESCPDGPSLFGGAGGREYARYVQRWCESRIHPLMMTLIILDIQAHLAPEDVEYFNGTRPQRFGRPLEEVQSGRDERVIEYRDRLEPLRRVVAAQPFMCGSEPSYADHIVMGSIIGARRMSSYPLFVSDDPIYDWMHRCLDLYDGLGQRGVGYNW